MYLENISILDLYTSYLQPNRAVDTPYKIALDIPLFHICTVIVLEALVTLKY